MDQLAMAAKAAAAVAPVADNEEPEYAWSCLAKVAAASWSLTMSGPRENVPDSSVLHPRDTWSSLCI
jgi:hypothetical protein